MLVRSDILQVWNGEPIPRDDDFVSHPLNIEQLWTAEELATWDLYIPVPFEVPEGYRTNSSRTYIFDDGVVYEHYNIEEIPVEVPSTVKRMIARNVIVERLYAAGLLDSLTIALRNDSLFNERWYFTSHYFYDDAIIIELLESIGADPEEILSEV